MSAREAYGPKSSSSTVAGVCPRPLTVRRSKISASGLDHGVGDDRRDLRRRLGERRLGHLAAGRDDGVVAPRWRRSTRGRCSSRPGRAWPARWCTCRRRSPGSVPVQNGVPSQVIASRDGYGPHSSTLTVAASLPSPVTTTESVICAPGVVSCALIWVVIAGCAAHDRRLRDLRAGGLRPPAIVVALGDRLAVRVVAGHASACTGAVTYSPSPVACSVPVHTGASAQVIASRAGYGP